MKGDIVIDKLMLKIEKHLKPNDKECHHYNRCYEEIHHWFSEQKKLWEKEKSNDKNNTR